MSAVNELLLGAGGMASLAIAAFFARFWRATHDRLFMYFAASFALEGVNRFLIGIFLGTSNDAPFYLIRLTSFLLILTAIVGKNWRRPSDRHKVLPPG
jgi:hypothetical protein